MSNEQRPTDPGQTNAPQFDPRHSPVFQRGYDPSTTDGPAPSKAQGRASARRFSDQERTVDSAVIHGVDGAVAPPSAPVAAAQQPPAELTDEWAGDRPARNPFIVALWIIGVGLVVSAVWFQWWALSRNNSYSGNTSEMPIEFVLQQLSWSISTPMISSGILTIVGLIAWKAVRWHGDTNE